MRIIDNKKDYYDYLAGVWGIDEYITYDRRNSKRLFNKAGAVMSDRYPMGYGNIFCPWKNGNDPQRDGFPVEIYDWDNGIPNQGWRYRKYGYGWAPQNSQKFPDTYNVKTNFFTIIIGSVVYDFIVYRVLQNQMDKEVKIVPKLWKKYTINRSLTASKAPILIGNLYYDKRNIPWRSCFDRDEEYYRHLSQFGYVKPDNNGEYMENPILDGTWIPSMIPATEVWNNITDYLLSIKEPKIVDNRTDVQHLESHGFDKKTSFRNVK